MDTLIVIEGPTAVGKTQLSVLMAKRLGIDIINADSRQMFRGMTIGTAAPREEDMQGVRHHFVASLDIGDYYSAAMFEADVMKLLESKFARTRGRAPDQRRGSSTEEPAPGGIALMSGGSMMYIDAVCRGIDNIPTITEATRGWIRERLEREGLEKLVEELRAMDPDYYDIVDKRNTRRVVHALEICHQTGRTYTSFRLRATEPRPFKTRKVGLTRPREELYERINRRVDLMMAEGLEEEARALLPSSHLNSLNTVGYKEMFAYMRGEWSLEEAIERIKSNTRRYARKQLTWMKRDEEVRWFHPDDKEAIYNYITQDD